MAPEIDSQIAEKNHQEKQFYDHQLVLNLVCWFFSILRFIPDVNKISNIFYINTFILFYLY